ENDDGHSVLHLMVGGLHCAACVWLIENVLTRSDGVVSARLNMTTRRLVIAWRKEETSADQLVAKIAALGYRLAPYDPALLEQESADRQNALLRAMAVAGFAAGNVMLLSVSVWSGSGDDMGPSTRSLLHWLSALIAMPATVYAGQHFFRSALGILRARRMNMDVPISLALILTAGMSLFETIRGTEHVYFDSVLTLLFFLLVGRYLDTRARGRARAVGEHLLSLSAGAVTVYDEDGAAKVIPPDQAQPGMTILAAVGERVAVDGEIIEGASEIDRSLINGETLPCPVNPGDAVEAGSLNISAPIKIRVTASGEDTLLAGIVRLMEDAEQSKSRYVTLADRIARLYAPVVHLLALLTFAGWMTFSDAGWQQALLTAVAVLIITCPCALALAVPTVQVVASGRLFKRGILLKSGSALERLAVADKVVFDKTGTVTRGRPELLNHGMTAETLQLAASLAANSKHPLSRALVRAVPSARPASKVTEIPGQGLSLSTPDGDICLGRREWCGIEQGAASDKPELWLSRPGSQPQCLQFSDTLRPDAAETIQQLKNMGLQPELLSGDRETVVADVAGSVAIENWKGEALPADKVSRLNELTGGGSHALMVGDGLNDAPALAAASVSMSPSSAADISQNAADIVFQGEKLQPVVEAINTSRRADFLVKQNIGCSFLYNAVTIPLSMTGHVSPLMAAIAMSSSSLVVIVNALRLARK
ncbi:MAG: cadmium-translocating P-type ATPase, partial [Rhodospirillaceae bacterium]|nr:cadmium-translocating P-type ATPase [Rhodospirillaceae bacterium]